MAEYLHELDLTRPPMTSTRALALVLSAQHRTPDAVLAQPWIIGAAEIEAALRELGYQVLPAIPMPRGVR